MEYKNGVPLTCLHQPVMVKEVLENLITNKKGIYIDCTIGEGGHSQAILEALEREARLIGIDRDAEILEVAQKRLNKLCAEKRKGIKVFFINTNFINIRDRLRERGMEKVEGVLFDLGISSFHLDKADRGFSFQLDGPLDMRMDKEQSLKASDIVNHFALPELSKIIFAYGEERNARQISQAIVRERAIVPINTTGRLAKIIQNVLARKRRKGNYRPARRRLHPATRTFQALRICVNKELENLEKGLIEAIGVLKKGGRICVLSYHSLEDRISKNIFRAYAQKESSVLHLMTKKPLRPGEEEIRINPRARSARLRVAQHL